VKFGTCTAILPDGRKIALAYRLRGYKPESRRIEFWPEFGEPMPEGEAARDAMEAAVWHHIDNAVAPR
jgi:hypothetical protein